MSSAAEGLTVPGLDGAAIIVTGGGSGIGAATARRLGPAGAAVVLVGRRPGLLDEVAAGIAADGGRALCVAADLADPDSPDRITDACLDRFGRIDGLVNNAAVIQHRPLGEWDAGGFDEHVAVNVRAPFFLIQAALPALRESPVRSVVNVSSSSGTLRRVGQSVYGMTKSALDYLTQTLAASWRRWACESTASPPARSTPPSTRPGPRTWPRRTGGWAARCRSGGSAPRRRWPCGSRCC